MMLVLATCHYFYCHSHDVPEKYHLSQTEKNTMFTEIKDKILTEKW